MGKGGDKMAKNDQKCWSQPGFKPGAFQEVKKVRNFCLKLYHCTEPQRHFINFEQNIVGKLVNSNLCLVDMEHDLNLTLKMCKSAFSVKQIIEIKKKMHIDPIFTYSDSEIALKVCRNKQRFKLNRSPL